MTKPIIYGHEMSSVVRSVLMVAKEIGLEIEYKELNLEIGEHQTEQFLKMNPQHTIPTLDDNGFFLADSHAIGPYLIMKYGKNNSLYPHNDPPRRAKIDQMLHFDNGILYVTCLRGIVMPIYREGASTISSIVLEEVYKAYKVMETFLESTSYLVGDSMTIADIACGATISSLFGLVACDPAKHPKLHAWFQGIQALPYYEELNGKGNRAYLAMLAGKKRKEGE